MWGDQSRARRHSAAVSKSTSTRAASVIDWPRLLAAVSDESGVTPEAQALWLAGRWSDPRPSAGREYLDAMQQALEKRDTGALLAMLDGGMPVPDALLPILAEVIRDLKRGYATGRPKELTALSDETIRQAFDRLRKFDPDTTVGELHLHLAEIMRVSVDTIKRSLKKTKPHP